MPIENRLLPVIPPDLRKKFPLLVRLEVGRHHLAYEVIYDVGIPWEDGLMDGQKLFVGEVIVDECRLVWNVLERLQSR